MSSLLDASIAQWECRNTEADKTPEDKGNLQFKGPTDTQMGDTLSLPEKPHFCINGITMSVRQENRTDSTFSVTDFFRTLISPQEP